MRNTKLEICVGYAINAPWKNVYNTGTGNSVFRVSGAEATRSADLFLRSAAFGEIAPTYRGASQRQGGG